MRLLSRNLLVGFSACLLMGAVGWADAVTGTGSWQSWSAANLIQGHSPTPGVPYWNNLSGDGSRYNIGWCLTGGGSCSLPDTPGNIPYFGPSGGASPANMAFASSGHSVTATLETAITDSRALDSFGWYSIGAAGSIGPLHELFSPSDADGAVQTFTPTGEYGFYVEQDQGVADNPFASKYLFFMDGAKNLVEGYPNPSDHLQHFAIFNGQTGGSDHIPYYIGAVDTRACVPSGSGTCDPISDFDYNDFVVRLDTLNTPEPGSLGLLACSLILLMAFLRRRRFSH